MLLSCHLKSFTEGELVVSTNKGMDPTKVFLLSNYPNKHGLRQLLLQLLQILIISEGSHSEIK